MMPAGAKIGAYEILELIGKGGMGEVYRARDSKLGRDVAIKLLPDDLARDRDRLDRFEREARLLAKLNHANIATLHGLEAHDGRRCLVMEVVEGETLADRITRGPMASEEVIPLFIQIAEGLEAAHEKDVIHRDLKPANMKITPEGNVKLLDFGLARLAEAEPETPSEADSQSPTLTKGTALGVILGTASYMSPEQARGASVDKRADIWAFGCCLYEALTGGRPFEGDNVTDILAAVVRAEPDMDRLPPVFRDLVARCLTKDPRLRLRDIGDGRIELGRLSKEAFSETSPAAPAASARTKVPAPLALIAAALLAGLGAGWMLKREPPPPTATVRRLDIRVPRPQVEGVPAISPDGSSIAFRSEGRAYLWKLEAPEPELLVNSQTAASVRPEPLFFSPDGEWVGFISRDIDAGARSAESTGVNVLYKLSLRGGAPVRLADLGLAGTATWGDDDRVYFSRSGGEGIFRVSPDGGEPEKVTEPESGTHVQPEVLPGATGLLYVVLGPDNQPSHIEARSLPAGNTRELVSAATMPRFSPTGHLVFEQNGNLLAAAFDPERLELTGPQVTLVEGVARVDRYYGRIAAFSFSRTGDLIYRRATARNRRDVVWVDREGNEEPTGIAPGDYMTPTLSPDGRYLCLNDSGQLWVHDLEGGTRIRVTRIGASYQGVWTPDGRKLIFSSPRNGRLNLFWQPVDGSGPAEPLATSESTQYANNVSAGGTLALYQSSGRGSLWTLQLGSSDPPTLFHDGPQSLEGGGKLSPDGRWMAYESDESGHVEVYLRPFPGPGPRVAVSVDGGNSPMWSRDGRELFYRVGDRILGVRLETDPELRIVERRELFRGAYHFPGGVDYDVAPDGRFVMVKDITETLHADEIVLVEGWFTELERLASAEE